MFTHRQPSPRRERGGPRRGVQSGQAVRRDSSKDPGEREWLCLQTRDLCGRRQRLQHTYPPRPSWALGILFTKTVTATASAAERPRRRRAPACGRRAVRAATTDRKAAGPWGACWRDTAGQQGAGKLPPCPFSPGETPGTPHANPRKPLTAPLSFLAPTRAVC